MKTYTVTEINAGVLVAEGTGLTFTEAQKMAAVLRLNETSTVTVTKTGSTNPTLLVILGAMFLLATAILTIGPGAFGEGLSYAAGVEAGWIATIARAIWTLLTQL